MRTGKSADLTQWVPRFHHHQNTGTIIPLAAPPVFVRQDKGLRLFMQYPLWQYFYGVDLHACVSHTPPAVADALLTVTGYSYHCLYNMHTYTSVQIH